MILVTGASGYIGRALMPALQRVATGERLVAAGRSPFPGIDHRPLDLGSSSGFRDAVLGAGTVIHLGGLAHNQGDEAAYKQVNVRASMSLADAALAAGVRRLIFVSSLNVVPASVSDPECPAAKLPSPENYYAASKWRAEQALSSLLAHSSCDLTIVRPALVYDRELTANLAALAELATRLPFALPQLGARSMISRPDLVELLCSLAIGYRGGNETRLPADDGGASSLRILAVTDGECYQARRIAAALGASAGIKLPTTLWRLAARLRDGLSGLKPGSTWQSLAGQYWCGALSTPSAGCRPRYTLESLMTSTVDGAVR